MKYIISFFCLFWDRFLLWALNLGSSFPSLHSAGIPGAHHIWLQELKKHRAGTENMAQQLRVLVSLVEDQSLDPKPT